jgi:ribosomal protein S18
LRSDLTPDDLDRLDFLSRARAPGRRRSAASSRDKATYVDYKDTALLRKFISDRGKIRARRVTRNCVQHQRDAGTVDVLLIDDIQFLEGQDPDAGGVLHTFNTLHNANKQVIGPADRPSGRIDQPDRSSLRERAVVRRLQGQDPRRGGGLSATDFERGGSDLPSHHAPSGSDPGRVVAGNWGRFLAQWYLPNEHLDATLTGRSDLTRRTG